MIDFDLKLCGSRMRKVRKEMFCGTVKDFCDKFEFSAATMYDCENGKIAPRPYVVVGICREFGVSADWRLRFERLDFGVMIADMLEQTPPKDMKDLRWMVKVLIESTQLVAWEYTNDNFDNEDWEDVFYPADAF